MATSALMVWSLPAPYGAEDEAIGADDAAGADEIGAADDAASDAGADDTPGAAIDNSELSTTTGGVTSSSALESTAVDADAPTDAEEATGAADEVSTDGAADEAADGAADDASVGGVDEVVVSAGGVIGLAPSAWSCSM